LDKLSAMKTFVRVAEAGSFSAVASESGTTQSAVSKQVAALERELGAKLFSRTTRSISLTDEGERYFESARRLVSEVEEAEASVRKAANQMTGWIRVAASVGFGRLKLMPIVKAFMAAHPQVKIDLRLHDGFIDLIEQGIDVSVRIGDLPDSGLLARRVGTSRRMLLAHRDYLRRLPRGLGRPAVPEDLRAHNCVVYTGLSTPNLWSFTAGPGAHEPAGTVRVVRVEGNLQTNSSEVMRAAMNAAMGIGYLPDWLLEAEIRNGTILRVMPHWDAPQSPIHLVSPPQRRHAAKVRALGDFIAAQMQVANAAA